MIVMITAGAGSLPILLLPLAELVLEVDRLLWYCRSTRGF